MIDYFESCLCLQKDKKDKKDKKEKEDKLNLELTIVKGAIEGRPSCTSVPAGNAAGQPFCRFVNVKLMNCKPSGDATGTQGTVLLENPHGNYMINLSQLKHQVHNTIVISMLLKLLCKHNSLMSIFFRYPNKSAS